MDFDFLTKYDIGEEEAQKLEKSRDFSRWSEMPPELKCIVIGHLDFKSKVRLSSCSKLDYALVDSSTFKISLLQASEVENSIENKVCVQLAFGQNDETTFSKRLTFTKSDDDCIISWKGRMNRKEIRKYFIVPNSDYYEESFNFIEKWLKYDIKYVSIEMNRLPLKSRTAERPLGICKQISIDSQNGIVMKYFLERLEPHFKTISLTSHESDNSSSYQFLFMDHFKMSDNVYLFYFADCSDEQFLSISAKDVLIRTNSVTDQAVNQFIHNWLNGKMREDFQACTIWFKRELVKAEILKNVEFSSLNDTIAYKQSFEVLKHDGSGKRLKIVLYRTWICMDVENI